MTTSQYYPLIVEQSLPRPGKRNFWRWRDPAGLPEVPPGAVLVFRDGDRYDVIDGDRPTGYEDVLLDASAVGVVDRRPRSVTVEVPVSSIGQAHPFPVRVTFEVRVTDPAVVFRDGVSNLKGWLQRVLQQDKGLIALNDKFDVDQLVPARAAICAHIVSAYGQRPPRREGVRIAYEMVTVGVPEAMMPHVTTMQGLRWEGAEETLRQAQERQSVGHVGSLMQTPQQARALAVSRGEMTSAEAARETSADEQRGIEMLRAEVWRLEDSGEADRDAVDRRHLLQRLDTYLTGSQPPRSLPQQSSREQVPPAAGEDSVYIPSDDDDDD